MFEFGALGFGWLLDVLEVLTLLFIFAIGLVVALVIVLYIRDKTQTKHTILRNYPVIGRFRYIFEHIGEFLRQYFFAMDREELPFNRAQRSWVYRAAKDVDFTAAFGSTRNLTPTGSLMFANCMFPVLNEDSIPPSALTIGEKCDTPYTTSSLINISGMSYGALSRPAVKALSNGAGSAGCWMNTGEGGLSEWHLEGGCDIVFQIGTAKYGVRTLDGKLDDKKLQEIAAHKNVRMLEIKMGQGAKPGKGGVLPGVKVTEEISKIRGIAKGEDSISPNGHAEISTVENLLDMIHRIRGETGKPVGFKTVLGHFDWVHNLFRAIHKRGIEAAPDFITIDSSDGGTGAAPQSLLDYVGMPISESLPMMVDLLNEYGLRERIKVITSGKLVNPDGVAWALAVGADFVVSARGFLFALGCIQALQCNKNTCPTGITTHNKKLQRGLVPEEKSQRVANYVRNMNYEVGVIAHSCGVREPRELTRHHVRIMTERGVSVGLDELYPEKKANKALWQDNAA